MKNKNSCSMKRVQRYAARFILIVTAFVLISDTLALSANDDYLLIDIEIRDDDRKIFPEEKIIIDTDIILSREKYDSIVDVIISHTLKDKDGKVYTTMTETKGALLRLKLTPQIIIPQAMPEGIYVLEVEAHYNDVYGKSSLQFKVMDAHGQIDGIIRQNKDLINVLILLFTVMSLIILILLYYKQRKIESMRMSDYKKTKMRKN